MNENSFLPDNPGEISNNQKLNRISLKAFRKEKNKSSTNNWNQTGISLLFRNMDTRDNGPISSKF